MENCELEPGRECHNSTRLAILEKRVEDLETGQGREEKFRKDYYKDREERNLRQQRLEGKITEMDGKLDKVVCQGAGEKRGVNQEKNSLLFLYYLCYNNSIK